MIKYKEAILSDGRKTRILDNFLLNTNGLKLSHVLDDLEIVARGLESPVFWCDDKIGNFQLIENIEK